MPDVRSTPCSVEYLGRDRSAQVVAGRRDLAAERRNAGGRAVGETPSGRSGGSGWLTLAAARRLPPPCSGCLIALTCDLRREDDPYSSEDLNYPHGRLDQL